MISLTTNRCFGHYCLVELSSTNQVHKVVILLSDPIICYSLITPKQMILMTRDTATLESKLGRLAYLLAT